MLDNGGTMKILLSCVFAFCLLTGCQNQAVDENRERVKSVMTIHDEAMAKMTDMHELKLSLQTLEKTSGKSSNISQAIASLQSAGKGMMNWMHDYKPPKTDTELKGAKEYLLVEKAKITQVQTDIDNSIRQAKELL